MKNTYFYDDKESVTRTLLVESFDGAVVSNAIDNGAAEVYIDAQLALPPLDQYDELEAEWFEQQRIIETSKDADEVATAKAQRTFFETGIKTVITGQDIDGNDISVDVTCVARPWCKKYRGLTTGGNRPTDYMAEHLATVKALKKKAVNRFTQAWIDEGTVYDGHVYDSDIIARNNITAALAAFGAGVPIPAGFVWRTQDNQNVPMDNLALTALAGAVMDRLNQGYVKSWTAKAAVDAAVTTDEVASVVL